MGRKNNLFYSMIIAFLLIGILVLYTGVELTIADEYLALLPYLVVILAGAYGIKNTHGITGIVAYAMTGIGFALMAYELNALGFPMVTDLLSVTFTIQYLEALIIIVFTIAGAFINAD